MRALLVTHGDLGRALIASAALIYGDDAPMEALSNDGLDAASLRQEIGTWLSACDGPALVLVDVGGGSCGIAARSAAHGREQTWVLGGVNLAMVLTFFASHTQVDAAELASKVLDRALNAVTMLDSAP